MGLCPSIGIGKWKEWVNPRLWNPIQLWHLVWHYKFCSFSLGGDGPYLIPDHRHDSLPDTCPLSIGFTLFCFIFAASFACGIFIPSISWIISFFFFLIEYYFVRYFYPPNQESYINVSNRKKKTILLCLRKKKKKSQKDMT